MHWCRRIVIVAFYLLAGALPAESPSAYPLLGDRALPAEIAFDLEESCLTRRAAQSGRCDNSRPRSTRGSSAKRVPYFRPLSDHYAFTLPPEPDLSRFHQVRRI
jgi:hypothetical protein